MANPNASSSAFISGSTPVYTAYEIEMALVMLLLSERPVVFSPPQQICEGAKRRCTFCRAVGHNVATCAGAPCNRCGQSGHMGRQCPDNVKGKKSIKGDKDKLKAEEATEIAQKAA